MSNNFWRNVAVALVVIVGESAAFYLGRVSSKTDANAAYERGYEEGDRAGYAEGVASAVDITEQKGFETAKLLSVALNSDFVE